VYLINVGPKASLGLVCSSCLKQIVSYHLCNCIGQESDIRRYLVKYFELNPVVFIGIGTGTSTTENFEKRLETLILAS
jgi:hypothetical protein